VGTSDPSAATFWRQAFEEHGREILGFLGRRVGVADAEDLLQETFVRVMRAPGAPAESGALRPYLFATARNLATNLQRHRRVAERLAPLRLDERDANGPALELAAPTQSPEERLEGLRLRADVARVLATLPDDHRVAFLLAVLERYTYAEIADRMGWSLARVKTNVYRARHAVLDALADRLPTTARSTP
jgi:RNA polymerase sigma-70 factor (ECF subfamily)